VDAAAADAYLDRIDACRPACLDADALRTLQRRHLLAVPFENLSIHLGEPVTLDEPALFDKIVHRRRGGFCYELNGLFALLLTALGFEAELLSARVHGDDGFGPPFDHLALRVAAPESPWPWLVDVGYGQFSEHPLRLDNRREQHDPGGRFRLVDTDSGDLLVLREDSVEYRLERRARALRDFEPACWWQATSPNSHFTRSLVCSRLTPTGRVTLSGRALIETVAGERHERQLDDDAAVLTAYQRHFGIDLDRVPELSDPGLRLRLR
jgi:N-hydroxyarylamine O-acetyltransferase